jgi:diguanylate cyclase (GGDEF)-like protein/PAS domain S-box-containing protein
MKLRKSIILITGLCFGVLLTFLFVMTRTLTYENLRDLEEDLIKSNLRRSSNAVKGSATNLDLLVADWSNWDDTYKFLQDKNEEYIRSNLSVETFRSQQNNLIILLNPSGEVVWGQYLPPAEESLASLPLGTETMIRALLGDGSLNRGGEGFRGIVSIYSTLFVISCKPVLASNYTGPSTGWLVMAKELSAGVIEEFKLRTELDLEVFAYSSPSLPKTIIEMMQNGLMEKAFPFIEKTKDSIRCTGQLYDVQGNGVAFMQVTSPRDIYNSGVQASQRLLVIILAAGGITAGLLLWLLEKKILKRIAHLKEQVDSVHDTELSSFTPLTGKDEISDLSRSILNMLHVLRNNFSELQVMQKFLSSSEERYKTLFMNTGNACVVVAEDTTILLANQEFYKIMKIPEGIAVEGKLWVEFFHSDEIEMMKKYHYLRRLDPSMAPRKYETRYQDYTGRIRYAILTVAMIPGTRNSSCSLLDITDQKKAEEELKQKAFYDSLTGLPNRQLFHERLKHAIDNANRNTEPIGVLLLDIDEFKNVNDTRGHHAGDIVLQSIAGRISKCIRTSDTLARLGGDEFVIIVESPQDIDCLCLVADNIISDFMTPYVVEDSEFHLGVSVGIAVYPDAGKNPEVLLKNADLAMYESKKKGKNRYNIFTHVLDDLAQRRLTLDRDIRQALANDKFEVYYQPKVMLNDGRIYGMEALVRGKNDDGSIIPPGEFIPYAEANGLIIPIDLFVMKKACRQTAQWIKEGFGHMTISVNISTKHFRKDNFVAQVNGILEETGLSPSCLELEVTETAMMKDFDQTISFLKKLRSMGIAFSLDDFGTGYSSLNYLHSLPIQTLKIDKSFIDHICDDSSSTLELVKIIILLSKAMNIDVVAEGVETLDQQRVLQSLGCEQAQGYLFAKPLPHEQFRDLLVGNAKRFPLPSAIKQGKA